MVGLDIGADTIKVVEAQAGRDGITVTGLGIANTPLGGFIEGKVADPQLVGKTVKALLSESGVRGKRVVSSCSGQSAMPSLVVRVIRVPTMTPEELKETMKWEVEKHVPFAPSEVVMDYQKIERIGQDPNAQEMEVLLAVAQQDMVDNQISAIYAAGLKPASIDIQPLAASRALIDIASNGAAPMTAAILEVGATVAELDVFENGLLSFPAPPIQIAGVNFTQAIAAALGVTEEEAERLKKERARIDPAQIAAFVGGVAPAPPAPALGEEPPPADLGTSSFDLPSGGFTDTVGGPVFDLGDEDDGPKPPRIDLSDTGEDQQKVYDVGGVQFEARKPVFDLSEAEAGGAPTAHAPTPAPEVPPLMPADTDVQARIAQAIAPVLSDLVNQIRLNLDYYRQLHNSSVERIYLSGGTAMMHGLDAYLSAELGVPVLLADPLGNVSVASKQFSPQYLREVSPIFSVSLGLAIRDLVSEG